MAKPTIFISYSHNDEEWKDKLVTHLGILHQQDYLDIWVDTRIEGGDDWFQEIKQAIDATSIAVLLISADFLNSKFITEQEIPMLLRQRQEKGLRIFPIILKPCDWLGIPWLTKFLARPKDGRPLSAGDENQIETDLAAIAKEIRELLQRAGLPREKREYVPLPPDQVSLSKLPTTQHALFGRDEELKLIDDAWQNPHCHVLSFVAFGGVGKTALVNEWLNRMELDSWRGAERVYGWSFYSQGTREDRQVSADTFFEDALRFFGYMGEPIKSPWDKGKLLASLIKERKTLLILDGLEPLQYPPGVEEGRLRDQGLQALLKELARFNNGLCLITTRCKVTDIEHTLDKTTHQIDLENLSPQAGMQVLREAGVTKGTDQELQGAAAEYDGHALALSLLGSYLATVYDGEIRKRDLIPQLTEDMEHGGHAKRVMESYETWLTGTAELEILYLMGLFDRPAPLGAIDVLIKKQRINGLTDKLHNISEKDWRYAVKHLRDLRLLSASEADTLDCHPLIREHFGEKLKAKGEQAWIEAHERLYEYYKNLPEKELPDTLEEMEPLFAAVTHGCLAGFHQQVIDEVYWPKINRSGEYYSMKKLGAFGTDLSAISNFFTKPWTEPDEGLSDDARTVVFNWAGLFLRGLGRMQEAAQSMQIANEIVAINEDWENAAIGASTLSELYLRMGELEAAVSSAVQSVEFADFSKNIFLSNISLSILADSLHNRGKLIEANKLFFKAEKLQRLDEPEVKFNFSIMGFQFCDLLLSQGKVREVLARVEQTLEWALKMDYPLDIALDKLSLGRAYLLEEVEKMTVTSEVTVIFQQAADYLNQAVAGLRESGQQYYIPLGLFVRAFCYRAQNQFPLAWDDLEEARELAERGSMKLWLVDYHLEASRLLISEFGFRNGDHKHAPPTVETFHDVETFHEISLRPNHETFLQNANEHLKQAADLVQKTGYHRRDPDVELGFAGLFFVQGDQVKAQEHLGTAKAILDKMGIRCWDFEVRRLESELRG